MKKFYPASAAKLCLVLIATCLLTTNAHAQVVTYDTTFDGWNAIVTADLSLKGKDSAAGIIFFPGIGEQTKNISDLQKNGPHYLIKNKMWDGSVTLGNGVHHPFIISLQPPTSGYPAMVVKPKIDAILARYRIKRNSLYFTALSLGSWQANEFLAYEATPGDNTYGRMVRAMVNLEGEEPADYTGIYASLPYPNKMGHWAKACGGRELWVEGSQDWRDMLAGAQNMMDSVPGSATYIQVNYGGGAHCCWNTEYEPSVTWTKGANSNILQVVGNQQVSMNVWQWLLRQGDTSMPSGAATTPAVVAPTANAGAAQNVTLPTNSVNLAGSGTTYNGAKVGAMSWAQTSGPNNSNIKAGNLVSVILSTVANILGAVTGTTNNLSATVSGLIAGTYTYQLTVKDNNGLVSTSSVTVTVKAAAAPPPPAVPPPAPNVSAGSAQAITLPNTTATLSGTAAGSNGAKIASVAWQQTQGPVTATIASPSSLSTKVTVLKAAGTYVFRMTVTDKNGKQAASVVNVVVNPAVAATPKAPPTVSAGKGQAITLPASSVTLAGVTTGNDGATIKGLTWKQVQGPVTVKIASAASISTAVSGLTAAGNYVFQLTATDNNGMQASASITVAVNPASVVSKPAPPTPPAPPAASPTVSGGAAQTISLPNTTATLTGTAAGSNGSKIKSVLWQQSTGPITATIASPSVLSTKITLLKSAGTYVFRITVTDQNGKQAASVVNVVVKPAAVAANPAPAPPPPPPASAKVAPTVSAGPNLTITLPTNAATLNGAAKGNSGAVVNSWFWVFMSGPSLVKFSNEWAVSTNVSGLVAGTYVFELMASDNNNETSTATMTLVVKPKPGAAGTGASAMTGDAMAVTDQSVTDSLSRVGGLVIYPNPVHDLLNIHLNNDATGKVVVVIFNMKGARMQSIELEKEGASLETSIDVSRLPLGVYVIETISGSSLRKTEKFIKQ